MISAGRTPKRRKVKKGEVGSALIVALFSLLMASLIGMGVAYTGIYEVKVSRNYNTATEAFYIAEGGLNHAVRVIVDNNLDFKTVVAGADGILNTADDGILVGASIPDPDEIPAAGINLGTGTYTVIITGDDSSSISGSGSGGETGGGNSNGGNSNSGGNSNGGNSGGGNSNSASLFEFLFPTVYAFQGNSNGGNSNSGGGNSNGGNSGGGNSNSGSGSGGGVTGPISRLIVTSTGVGSNNSLARLEAILTRGGGSGPGGVNLGAGDSFDMSGGTVNCTIHANGDINLTGNATVNGDVYAVGTTTISGSASVSGSVNDGAQAQSIPTIDPEQYRPLADYILEADGEVRDALGALVGSGVGSGWNGWTWSGPTWNMGSGGVEATIFVEGDVQIAGNHGSSSDPFDMTLIATGSINITGNNDLGTDYEEIQLVAGTDIRITGNVTWTGWIGAHEQFYYSGSSVITGPVYAENAGAVSSLVTANTITGNALINCGGSSGSSGLKGSSAAIRVISWREIRL